MAEDIKSLAAKNNLLAKLSIMHGTIDKFYEGISVPLTCMRSVDRSLENVGVGRGAPRRPRWLLSEEGDNNRYHAKGLIMYYVT